MKYSLYITILIGLLFLSCKNDSKQDSLVEDKVESIYQFGICIDSLTVDEYQVKSGDNLSGIFGRFDFSGQEVEKILNVLSELLHPKSLRPGMSYYTFTTQDTVSHIAHFVFARSQTDFVIINFLGDSIRTETFTKPITIKRKYSEGIVTSSLWNAIVESGADPILALKLSDIYAWEIDFFGIQQGDAFKVIYDEAYIDDTLSLSIEAIQGAVFTHNKKEYIAIPFVQDSVRIFFNETGNSMRKAFLKSPMDFFRITSKFTNSRYHPVLKRYRAHHGVDYAAPTGTPVKTIGNGTVIEKGFQKGGAGNYLKIKHNSTYTTTYMHLSRFGKGVGKGSRVEQGQVIGYVGSTGLSTGPHLDFRVYKNGKPINPLTMDAPPDTPVKPELRDSFMLIKERVLSEITKLSTDTVQ